MTEQTSALKSKDNNNAAGMRNRMANRRCRKPAPGHHQAYLRLRLPIQVACGARGGVHSRRCRGAGRIVAVPAVVETVDQIGDGGFASTGCAHQCDLLSGLG